MSPNDKPLVWLYGEVKTPPMTADARAKAGYLLRRLQAGDLLEMPHSRPMPSIGRRVHELRIVDADVTWRIIFRIDPDAIVVGSVFGKKTQATPKREIEAAQRRFNQYDAIG